MNSGLKHLPKIKSRVIHTVPEFQKIIRKERSRTDRSSFSFSIILYDTAQYAKDSNLLSVILKALISRVRISDEIGWMDNQTIGVLLTDTKLKGARNLADDIASGLLANNFILPFRILTYPSIDWNPLSDDESFFRL